MSLKEFKRMLIRFTKHEIINFLFINDLLACEMFCEECNCSLVLKKYSKIKDGISWQCIFSECQFYRKMISIRKYSFFDKFNLSIIDIILVLLSWSNDEPQHCIINEYEIDHRTYKKIIYKFLNLITPEESRKLGGLGKIVQVDETSLNHGMKNHRGRSPLNKTDALCIIEFDSYITRAFACVISDKKASTEKEALAIVWSVEKLKVYLANKFIIKTDHSALVWLMKQKNPTGRLARWVMKLQNYQFDIEHIKGTENTIADVLSRGVLSNRNKGELKSITIEEESLDIEKDEKLVTEIIMKAHLELGHGVVESTAMYIKNVAKIPNVRKKIVEYISRCETCMSFKDRKLQNNIKRIEIKSPFYMIGLDLVGPLSTTENGNKFIIVGTDYLTKWAETRALKKKTAEGVAKFIYEEFVLRHGPPEVLLTDQGLEFNNKIVKKLCDMINTRKAFTSAYNPRCNGQTERLNKTLIAKLAKL